MSTIRFCVELGESRPDGEYPHRCSRCKREIRDEEVPFLAWAQDDRNVMWVICDDCTEDITPLLIIQHEQGGQ